MKRLFYSTVAVLAFSVSGMANTIELEDFESKKILECVENDSHVPPSFAIALKKLFSECNSVYSEVLTAYTPIVGQVQAASIANGAYLGCLGAL